MKRKEESLLFLKKKKQKNFFLYSSSPDQPCVDDFRPGHRTREKFFCFFFFKKRRLSSFLLIFLTALLLTGCTGEGMFSRSYDAYSDAPPDSPRGQCERAAYDDPAVKEQLAKNAASGQAEGLKTLAALRLAAVQRCLNQRNGHGLGGGVELPRQ